MLIQIGEGFLQCFVFIFGYVQNKLENIPHNEKYMTRNQQVTMACRTFFDYYLLCCDVLGFSNSIQLFQ